MSFAEVRRRHCPYCGGRRVVDNAVDGMIACRVCLGTGNAEPYGGDLGHDARVRELRRIGELVRPAIRASCAACAGDPEALDTHLYGCPGDHLAAARGCQFCGRPATGLEVIGTGEVYVSEDDLPPQSEQELRAIADGVCGPRVVLAVCDLHGATKRREQRA